MQKKVLTVVGARPQFIKAAVVSRALAQRPHMHEMLVHTGQHFDSNMSDVFFSELGLATPGRNLGIGGGSHGQNTGRMIEQLEEVMKEERPHAVLVYGDTDSTLAASLAAVKLHIPIAHVEAGLRSFNRLMPEEINRVLTDHVSSFLYPPTDQGVLNLAQEGIKKSVWNVGDVMYDAVLHFRELGRKPQWFDGLGLSSGFALCTIHRAENTDDRARMQSILDGLSRVGNPIVLPIHPRTRKTLKSQGLELPQNVVAVDPVGYLEMAWLEKSCSLVITDSGGVQKEAFFHAKPCVTLRDETEWVELVDLGANQIVGSDADRIEAALRSAKFPVVTEAPYGDGHAGERIASSLESLLT